MGGPAEFAQATAFFDMLGKTEIMVKVMNCGSVGRSGNFLIFVG